MDSRLMTYEYITRVRAKAIGLAVECDRLADQVWAGEDEAYLRLRADIAAGKVEVQRDSLEIGRLVVPRPAAPAEAPPLWLRLARLGQILRWLL